MGALGRVKHGINRAIEEQGSGLVRTADSRRDSHAKGVKFTHSFILSLAGVIGGYILLLRAVI